MLGECILLCGSAWYENDRVCKSNGHTRGGSHAHIDNGRITDYNTVTGQDPLEWTCQRQLHEVAQYPRNLMLAEVY